MLSPPWWWLARQYGGHVKSHGSTRGWPQPTAFTGKLASGRLSVPSPPGRPQRGYRRPRRSCPVVIWERALAWRVEEGGKVRGLWQPHLSKRCSQPPLGAKARGGDCPSSPSMGRGTTRRMGLGMPKHEVGRPRFGPLFRDMEPARVWYKNYVSDQRYHNAVDGTRNKMRNLFIQIRIVFSIVGTLHER